MLFKVSNSDVSYFLEMWVFLKKNSHITVFQIEYHSTVGGGGGWYAF